MEPRAVVVPLESAEKTKRDREVERVGTLGDAALMWR